VAQTNIQLYNQLRDAGRSLEELVAVHRAYKFLSSLHSGYYQADGKPFVAHGVGVASVLARLDQPADILVVGLLHNVYGGAGFGDGRGHGATTARRRLVREAVGDRVEGLLARFPELRITPQTVEEARRALPERSAIERRLILVDLADHLEKYVDLGVLYFGENDWVVDVSDAIRGDLIAIAEALGEPRLAVMLSEALVEASAQADHVPAQLRSPDAQRHLALVVPRSCRRRLRPTVGDWNRWLRGRLRIRTRVRSAESAVRQRLRTARS
jgi:hypothetical protein